MFVPNRVFIEKKALDYELGKKLYNEFIKKNTEVIIGSTVKYSDKDNPLIKYKEGKKTLVVGVKRVSKFETCKPSAHYQLPLVSGCIGQCEYCYLTTQLGDKPYTKIYVNTDDILSKAKEYIDKSDEITVFEGAATSDPVPIEPYTGILSKTINFFANEEKGRFRFVTKYTDVDSLLGIKHNNHTTIRFSINTEKIIHDYEHTAPSQAKRIEAIKKVMDAGYPCGFIIAPVFLYDTWKQDYGDLLQHIFEITPQNYIHDLSFEVISHRFTMTAKNRILSIFPETTLPMDESIRKFKFGQFGYGKYTYTSEQLKEMKDFFSEEISKLFSKDNIKYII